MAATGASAEPVWVDARVATTVQLFEQGMVPGLPGVVTRVEPAFPFTLNAFARGGRDGLTAELAAWGRAGPRDGQLGDGDVTAAWVQFQRSVYRVRLGRQVALPGSSRYVRFDGLSAGVTLGPVDLDAYAGWVALPRWNRPRGAMLLGFVGDALSDPQLSDAQNRAGQVTAGARVGVRLGSRARAALAFHEQRDVAGLAFRIISADALAQPLDWLTVGGRVSFDAAALAVPEARVYADLSNRYAPVSFDYSYQSPALLLPRSSVLAAFGGAAWHELGVEARTRLTGGLTVTGRAAGQLYEGDRPGGRGSLKLAWVPGLDGRLMLMAEAGRAFVPPAGFTYLRLAGRGRVSHSVWTSADAALYLYDVKVRGYGSSLTATAAVEWSPFERVRVLGSATVLSTPYAAFEVQGLGRLVIDLESNSAAGDL